MIALLRRSSLNMGPPPSFRPPLLDTPGPLPRQTSRDGSSAAMIPHGRSCCISPSSCSRSASTSRTTRSSSTSVTFLARANVSCLALVDVFGGIETVLWDGRRVGTWQTCTCLRFVRGHVHRLRAPAEPQLCMVQLLQALQ